MTLSTKVRTGVSVSDDLAFEGLLVDRDRTVVDSSAETSATFARQIAPSANVQIDLGEIATLRFLAIEYDAAINIRLGAADADPLPLSPISEGQTATAVLPLRTEDGVWIENPSATANVSVVVTAVGDRA